PSVVDQRRLAPTPIESLVEVRVPVGPSEVEPSRRTRHENFENRSLRVVDDGVSRVRPGREVRDVEPLNGDDPDVPGNPRVERSNVSSNRSGVVHTREARV